MKKVYLSPAGIRDLSIGREGVHRLLEQEDEVDASSVASLERILMEIDEFWSGTSYEFETGERYILTEELASE